MFSFQEYVSSVSTLFSDEFLLVSIGFNWFVLVLFSFTVV